MCLCLCRRCSQMQTWFWILCCSCGVRWKRWYREILCKIMTRCVFKKTFPAAASDFIAVKYKTLHSIFMNFHCSVHLSFLLFVNLFLQWLWCLYVLYEVALACDLAAVDCIMIAEMSHTLGMLLENAAEYFLETSTSGARLFSATCPVTVCWRFKVIVVCTVSIWSCTVTNTRIRTHELQTQTKALRIFLFSCLISSSLRKRLWWCKAKLFLYSWGM